nr:hypothetical protein [Ardenticatena sp.]
MRSEPKAERRLQEAVHALSVERHPVTLLLVTVGRGERDWNTRAYAVLVLAAYRA